MPERILVVDDERPITESVRFALEREGYQAVEAHDGTTALDLARSQPFDLIVLDVMLPEVSGFEVCRILRQHSDLPILLLTAKSDESDRVVGLDIGADDYIVKPFSMRELLARVRAALRRRAASRAVPLTVGDLVLDATRHEVRLGESVLALTPKEYDLLQMLIQNVGIAMSRGQLLQKVWGYDYTGDERTVDVHISWLRRKLRDAGSAVRVDTVRGVGYRLEP
jgi:DNA-binding response OmpR family regulator